MNKDLEYVIEKMKKYSKICSLTYSEREFMNYLIADIKTDKYAVLDFTDCIFYKYRNTTPWLVTVHVDRIPVPPYRWRINKQGLITGQLDNVVSVAIVRLLMLNDTPVNILFTTKEENLASNSQLIAIHNSGYAVGFHYKILDMDIDVAVTMHEVEQGHISLRDRDSIVKYDADVLKEVRGICDTNGIAYDTKEGHWLMCEIGTTIREDPSVKGIYFGLPIFNYHSNHEIINTKCIQDAIKFFECLRNEYYK